MARIRRTGLGARIAVAIWAMLLGPTALAAGTWYENAPMTSARARLGAAVVGEEIFVAGGAGISGPRSSFDAYDPIGDFWRPLPPMPMGREQFGMTSAGKKVYLSGGLAGNDRTALLSRELWLFDTETSTWVQMSSMPFARRGHVLLRFEDNLYAIGGNGQSPEKVMIYSIAKDRWSVLSDAMFVPRSNLAAVAIGDDVIVMGGVDLKGVSVARVDKLNLASGNWSRLKDMPIARSGHVAGVLGGRIHVAGGSTLTPSRTYVEHHSMDLQANIWQKEPRLLTPRHSMAAAISGGRWHLIGGGSGSGFFTLFTVADAVETFIPSN